MTKLELVQEWVKMLGKYKLRNTMLDLLNRIEKDSGYSHLLLDNEMKKEQFLKADRGLLTEVVYGTIQRKITLDYYLNDFVNPNKKMQPWVRNLLRMSIYQMVYLDRVPAHAIIHEAVEIAKQRGHKGIASLVNGVLRNIQRKGVPDTTEISDDIQRLSIETSHPKWLVERWVNHYGYERTKDICEANLIHKPISVRVQPMKLSREQAIDQLRKEGYQVMPSSFSKQGIIIEKGNILTSDLFQSGFITIQDQSSMLVGEMLDVKSGMNVLDTCSAPGGKVTHLAEKMQNEGKIYAHDLHAKKINLIERKARELDLSIIDASCHDARHLSEKYEEESFDRILVDAPCSGLGVIRGKPDIKYHKKGDDIIHLADIQLRILHEVAPLLKKNGLLIYSTCTIEPTENEEVVRNFLHEHTNYKVDETFFMNLPKQLKESPGLSDVGLQLFPQTYETDGFFLTRLKKIN